MKNLVFSALCWFCWVAVAAAQVTPSDTNTSTLPAPEPEPAGTASSEPGANVSLDPALGASAMAINDDAAVAAELAKLGISTDPDDATPTIDLPLKLSGFADFSIMTLTVPQNSGWRGTFERHTMMYIGNFNLYMSKNLTDSVRMLGEVRFLLLPNGAPTADGAATGQYISTVVEDYADSRAQIKWGGIAIERVFLEWTAHRALTFHVGMYLTPYGIWNVDHGSPTLITIQRPFIIGEQLFPAHQTGAEVLGQFDLDAHNTLGYHVTISNGFGPVSDYRDFDANKALGGRVYWNFDGLGELRIGGSWLFGTDTAAHEVPALAKDGKHVTFTEKIGTKSDVLSLAADLQWKYHGLHFQTEVITQQRKYDEKGRFGELNPVFGQYLAPTDRLTLGAYALLGYRFDWFGVMPYGLAQFIDRNRYGYHIKTISVFGGINIRPIDALVLKLEYNYSVFPDGSVVGDDPLQLVQIQLAWAF